jgi:putative transcriptional regulator
MRALRGHLLIAAPDLLDPTFRRTVVLIGEHSESGAMGIVLNRPSTVTVEEAVEPLAPLVATDDPVHIGGPVEPEAVVVLGEFAEPERAGALVLDTIGFLPHEVDPDAIGDLGRARVYAGYAGWAAGQLERELEEESWIVERARPDDVFTSSPESLWSSVLRRKGGIYRLIARMPEDPSLN